jgi:MoaA/NifB/PqqE/SkfB family radical SAM enzyme
MNSMQPSTAISILKSWVTKKPFAAGIEITNRCNLHCPMCYWWAKRAKKELADEEMITLFRKLRSQGVVHASLVGGEPTLRPNLIRAASKIFPYLWVFTNGSFSEKNAPPLPNTVYLVSIDGTEKIHDKIRTKGLYKKVWKNFSNRPDCITSTTITKINKDEIEDLVAEWSKTKIIGMAIHFYTPIGGRMDIWPDWKERDRIIDKLLFLKKKHGKFILLSRKMLNQLRQPEVMEWSKNCPATRVTVSYAADGSIKKPCMIGETADCLRCGCWLATFFESLTQYDLETYQITRKILSAVHHR